MIFLSPGEKLKEIRTRLGLKQADLEDVGVSRNYISMVESNKRTLSKSTLKKLTDYFNEVAKEKNISIIIDENKLAMTPEEDAEEYCRNKLTTVQDNDDILELIGIGERYSLVNVLPKMYIAIANNLYSIGKYDNAQLYYYNALEIYDSDKDETNKFKIYNYIGKCKLKSNKLKESLLYLRKSHDFFNEKQKYDADYKDCLFNMALVYKKLMKTEKTLECSDKLLSLYDPEKEMPKYVNTIALSAGCYMDKGDFNTAITLYEDTLEKCHDDSDTSLGLIYNNLGLIYMQMNELSVSIEYFNKSIEFRKSYDMNSLPQSMINMASVYIKDGSYLDAITLLKDSLKLCRQYNDNEYILVAYKYLESVYKVLDDKNNLEKIYLKLLDYFDKSHYTEVIDIYAKLALIYLSWAKYDKCQELLLKVDALSR